MSGYGNSGHGGLSSLDYWRLADELSVIDATILITGNDPSEKEDVADDHGYIIGKRQRRDYVGYDAVFKSLRAAIRSNRLPANVHHWVAPAAYEKVADIGYCPLDPGPSCEHTSFDFLLARQEAENTGKTALNFSVNDLRGTDDFYIWKEPDWGQTTVSVDHLKDWLKGRGVFPAFFFPHGVATGFRDKGHPRYSPKLAACVAAWEAVQRPARNSSAKQTIRNWLQSNAAMYGVGDETGIVSPTVTEELSRIVNWDTKGGATPTAGSDEPEVGQSPMVTNNYQYAYPAEGFTQGIAEKRRIVDDSELPF